MLDLSRELRDVAAALDAADVTYALAGGLAVSIYTAPRATQDIDLLLALTRLTPAPSLVVKAPRVAEAPINMECKVARILPVGKAHLILGEIVQWHVRDDVYDAATGRLDLHRLRPVGRLTGNLYSHIHDIF